MGPNPPKRLKIADGVAAEEGGQPGAGDLSDDDDEYEMLLDVGETQPDAIVVKVEEEIVACSLENVEGDRVTFDGRF